MTQMPFGLSVSPSHVVSFCCRGNRVKDERRREWEGGRECEGDEMVMEQVDERFGSHVKSALLQCLCLWPCISNETQKQRDCGVFFSWREWKQSARCAWLQFMNFMTRASVHSDYCRILSPTTISEIGHLVSGRHQHTTRAERESLKSQWRSGGEIKGWQRAVKAWGFWFVFSSALICSAESSMLIFGLFSAAAGERQIHSDCSSQTQFGVWEGFTCNYMQSNNTGSKIWRTGHCSHSPAVTESNCRGLMWDNGIKIFRHVFQRRRTTSCFL